MYVDSWAAFYSFGSEKAQGSGRKKEGRRLESPPFRGGGRQNWNRKPNCIRRGRCAPLACRKPELPMQLGSPAVEPIGEQSMPPLTPLYCVWLNRLKFSQRKSSARVSVKENRLKRPKSKLMRPGPAKVLRPTLPKVRPIGVAKAAGLKRSGPRTPGTLDCTDAWGFPTRSGRE